MRFCLTTGIFSVLLTFCLFNNGAYSQAVPVCEEEEFDLEVYVLQAFPDCDADSIQITASTASGIAVGEYTNPFTVTSDGTITVEIFETDSLTACTIENIDIDLVEANFTATAVQGSCLLVDITPPTNTANCTYTYFIENDTIPGPISQYQFSNGGLQDILLEVQCGSCFENQLLQVDVDGPIVDLDLAAAGLFFDSDFGSYVLCTDETSTIVTLSDLSQQINSGTTSFTATITFPDGSEVSGPTFPTPYEFVATQAGLYTINYLINDGGCIAENNFELFVSNPNVSTQLDVPVTVEPFTCEDEVYEVNVCPNGCTTNPPGTVYEVILECTDFFYSTTTVPAVVNVPLNIASCGSSCVSGGGSIACSCDLVVRAIRPCANAVSNTICPFQIQPVPNANFTISPFDQNNTYCEGTTLFFDPTWQAEDCNGANPALSICEIQNPEWSISPSTGWSVPGNDLNQNDLSAEFTDPGEYTITFEWSNSCGISTRTQTVCIVPLGDPPVNWIDSPIYCVGEIIDPTVDLPAVPCIDANILWSGSDLSIANPTSTDPTIEFTETGSVELELEIDGLCNFFEESVTYTVCDEPEISLSQTDLELCVGQEFCFDELLSLSWNNCLGEVTWTFDSLPGSPIINPVDLDLCFTWDEAEELEFYIEVQNDCGFAYDTISVTVTEAPSCPIVEPGDFCIGDLIDISAPSGADPSTINWFFSTDNGFSFDELPGGMPDSPTVTTQYYVTSSVNECFCISDTVEASLVPEPDFVIEVSNSNPCPGDEIYLTTQPAFGDLTWDDGTDLITADTLFTMAPGSAISYIATLTYGTAEVDCAVSENSTVNPVNNPLSIGCNLPSLICEGDMALPIPSVSPVGGVNFIKDSNGDIVATDVNLIDPSTLPPGSYHFVYEIIESNCIFSDSCAFDITSPQAPDISPPTDTLCYNQTVSFDDFNNLGGTWSSSCSSSISPSGFFDPSGASCSPGSVVEIYYTGNCILNDTLEIYLIDIPSVSILQSNEFPCPGDVVTFTIDPPEELTTWTDDNGNPLGTGLTVDVPIDMPMTIIADVDVGVTTLSCFTQAEIGIAPQINPIEIDCSVFPQIWCTGDDPIAIPDVLPGGGTTFVTDSQGDVILTNPTIIQTEDLGAGVYYFAYEISDWGPGLCTFRDSCEFAISEPAIPVFEAIPDSICYNSVFNFNEVSGLLGQWSSSCLGSIDPTSGVFDPSAAACLPGSDIELVYSGNCIENDTLSVYLIPLPEASVDLPQNELCANECLPFSKTITGDYDYYEWVISWADQELTFVNEDPVFCPDEVGLNSGITVSIVLSVFTSSNPQCLVSEATAIEVIRIPDEAFPLTSPQCIEAAIELPDCEECDSYNIFFSNELNDFSCSFPGDQCAPPDTGLYDYELVYDFGACLSDTLEGAIQIVDVPFLAILEAEYDTCSPIVDYSLAYGGYEISVNWETSGAIQQTNQTDIDLYQTIINHTEEVEVDTFFTDVITVQNICGSVEATNVIFHSADPDFTLDPDSSIYCQGQTVFLDLGFAQPMQVDSIRIDYSTNQGSGGITLDEIPLADVPFVFDNESDTLVISFQVTSYNSCDFVTKMLTAFLLPTDVSADFDIPFSPPVCVGDSIPIEFNSSGNVDLSMREIETNDPNVEVLQVLGDWYLLPQEGFNDGELTVSLTEFGFCGLDFDEEVIVLGPSLSPSISSNDACRGGLVTLIPVLEQEADLIWQLTPDSSLAIDFPPPFIYSQPGIYFPSLTASAPGFCSGTYVDTVEIFDPIRPILLCDADCDGGRGCKVSFDAVSICVGLENPESFHSMEWFVRRQFFPGQGPEIEIAVDDLIPCEENLVRMVGIDSNGCLVEAKENIEFTDVLLYAPNAFTPNADGINDVFRPVISGDPVDYSMRIFDRWGNLVFESFDPEEPWLGNVEGEEFYNDPEIYSYIVQFLPCQPEEEEEEMVVTGMITLIR